MLHFPTIVDMFCIFLEVSMLYMNCNSMFLWMPALTDWYIGFFFGPQKQGETKEEKGLSKKARKAHARAQQEQEQAFTRDFFREFWPENV
jgi:hypothetical protein